MNEQMVHEGKLFLIGFICTTIVAWFVAFIFDNKMWEDSCMVAPFWGILFTSLLYLFLKLGFTGPVLFP